MRAVLVDYDQFSAGDLALELGADEIERARLGREHPVTVQAAEDERPEAERIAEADQLPFGQGGDGEGSLEPGHRVRDRLAERRRVVRDQCRDHLRVRGGHESDAVAGELLTQLSRVDQVAVVPERDRACAAVVDERLRVRPVRRAGRRVAGVTDRDLTVQSAQLLLGEDLRHEAEIAGHGQPALVRDGDAGRLLAAVLEREETEVADARDVALGGADAEDAAHQVTSPIWTRRSQPSPGTWSAGTARTAAAPAGFDGSSTVASVPLQAAASASARSSLPSERSCASERTGADRQRNSINAASSASDSPAS